jgi:hypothetical protein
VTARTRLVYRRLRNIHGTDPSVAEYPSARIIAPPSSTVRRTLGVKEEPRGLVGRAVGVSRWQLVGRAAQRLSSGYERLAQPVSAPGPSSLVGAARRFRWRGTEEAVVLRLRQTLVRLPLDDQFNRVQFLSSDVLLV